jgi:hypothetical protein
MTDNTALLPLLGDDADTWRKRNAHLFQSDQSLRWFFRQHKSELVERGGVVMLAGRWVAVPSVLDALVIELGQAQARRIVRAPANA